MKQLQAIRNDLQRGFIGLALRNQELVELNNRLTEQFSVVVVELNQIKRERLEKEIRKQTRANRKRLPKRDPMTVEIYKQLVKAAEGPTYINARTRIALCILAVTGIRINELLPLKVNQLQTLIEENLAIPYEGGNKDESRTKFGVMELWNTDYENPQEHEDDHEHGDEPEGIDWHQ